MELTAEIFAVGRWNGFEFSLVDLQRIAETFKALGDKHRVPLKFGHNNEQPMTDGQPALGWVTDVWVAGEKLMAKFSDIPEIVFNAMQKKLYNNVSVELDFDEREKTSEVFGKNAAAEAQSIRSRQSLESQGGRSGVGGVPGALTNQPPEPPEAPIVRASTCSAYSLTWWSPTAPRTRRMARSASPAS